jgi:hypothetical protein
MPRGKGSQRGYDPYADAPTVKSSAQKEAEAAAAAKPKNVLMTSELADKILAELEDTGDRFRDACERNLVNRTSFSSWISKHGTQEQKDRKDAINQSRADALEFKALDIALTEIDGEGYERMLTAKANATEISSLVTLANRIRPKANKTEVSGPEGGPITTHELSGLTDSERSSRIAAILERAGARRAGQPPADDSGDL